MLVPAESFLFQQDGTILKGTLLQKIAQSNFLLSIPTEKEGYFSESQLPRYMTETSASEDFGSQVHFEQEAMHHPYVTLDCCTLPML